MAKSAWRDALDSIGIPVGNGKDGPGSKVGDNARVYKIGLKLRDGGFVTVDRKASVADRVHPA